MMLTNLHIKQGNFLAPEHGIFLHGCNMIGVMGAGAALAVRKKYPTCYEQYRNICHDIENEPGDIIWYEVDRQKMIANALTQIKPGANANNQYIRQALLKCFEMAENKKMPIHTVKIGCGIGGLSWENDVLQIFQGFAIMFPNVDCTVWYI